MDTTSGYGQTMQHFLQELQERPWPDIWIINAGITIQGFVQTEQSANLW